MILLKLYLQECVQFIKGLNYKVIEQIFLYFSYSHAIIQMDMYVQKMF